MKQALLRFVPKQTVTQYQSLQDNIVATGCHLLTHHEQYRHCHYLPSWYELCADLTASTIVIDPAADFRALTQQLRWPGYIVKDYVKSPTAERGSIAYNADEMIDIINQLQKYRGSIEGGVCLREFEHLLPR